VLPYGRLIEFDGATTSAVVPLIHATQCEGLLAAWIQPHRASLYPPDLAQAGVDLAALLIVQVEEVWDALRAAELIARSGAFALVVLDLTQSEPPAHRIAWQGRLQTWVRQHRLRVVLLSRRQPNQPSFGPLVSLRVQSRWDGSRLVHRILKNKVGLAEVRDEIRQHPAGWDNMVPSVGLAAKEC